MNMKRLLSVVLAVSVAASPVPALAADPVCGDVNGSGTVTTGDALYVLRESVGQSVDLECAPPSLTMKTGEMKCYGSSRDLSVACAGTGEDAETQLGISPSYTDNEDGTVTDNTTGLVWEQQGNSWTYPLNDQDNVYRWASSTAPVSYTWQHKIAALNAAKFAGYADWRLPNIRELQTLVKFVIDVPPLIDRVFWSDCCFPGCAGRDSCTAPAAYWTSTTAARYPHDRAYVVNFSNGATDIEYKTALHQVRAVRGP